MLGNNSVPQPRVNLRRPDIMKDVHAQVESHYRQSQLVPSIRANNSTLQVQGLTIRLAKKFGFCYGVERAIDLAYAACKVYKGEPVYILGEIIHNPDVNEHLKEMGIRFLSGADKSADINDLKENDIVIIPAFGADTKTMDLLKSKNCRLVDTTCGDVMSVWKRIRQYSEKNFTSIIHGKVWHEETQATSSRATQNGTGHYLVLYTLAETDYVCNYIVNGGDKQAFLEKFKGAYSEGFDPDIHLNAIGVANQTTMLRGETEAFQERLRSAIIAKYGEDQLDAHFQGFRTICGATQERQDALVALLKEPLDLLLVIGGYNSSNTSHLAEMGEAVLKTYFIKNADKLVSPSVIKHYDLHSKTEIETEGWLPAKENLVIGITAGASCPNNLIEDTIRKLLGFKNIKLEDVLKTMA